MKNERTIKPSFVYHAELEGELKPHSRATLSEIVSMDLIANDNERDDQEYSIRDLIYDEVNRELVVHYSRAWDPNLELGRFKACEPDVDPTDTTGERTRSEISPVLRATWLSVKRSGSLSKTARELGVSVMTVRDRLIAYKIKVARRCGIEMGGVVENRKGRVIQNHLGRPTNAERAARAAA